MKIYTRTGDDGTTGLYGGERVPKTSPRVAAYGSVDETNSLLGLAAALLPPGSPLAALIERLQVLLFDLGADLATPPGGPGEKHVTRLQDADATALEAEIDALEAHLPPLTSFVLPGGTPAAAALHSARATARRAERDVWRAVESGAAVNPAASVLLNRLSDLLFTAARAANHQAGREDVPWKARG